jgi:hypothetical protein
MGVDSGGSHGCPPVSASKRPSTSSLRRFITSRPYVTVAELRRRFGLDDPDGISYVQRNGTHAWIGLPEREAAKIQDLWQREEVGLEFSVEVHAPVVVGIYPMRIARYLMDSHGSPSHVNGHAPAHGVIGGPLPHHAQRPPTSPATPSGPASPSPLGAGLISSD